MMMCRKQKGFNLVEVMVALFILAGGMLGMLNLQIQASRHSKTSYQYSQAGFFAQDILERMRANKGAISSYLITAAAPTPAATTCIGPAVSCTPQELAAWDIREWRTQLTAALPSATGSVLRVNNNYEIRVIFEDRTQDAAGNSDGVPQEYILATEL